MTKMKKIRILIIVLFLVMLYSLITLLPAKSKISKNKDSEKTEKLENTRRKNYIKTNCKLMEDSLAGKSFFFDKGVHKYFSKKDTITSEKLWDTKYYDPLNEWMFVKIDTAIRYGKVEYIAILKNNKGQSTRISAKILITRKTAGGVNSTSGVAENIKGIYTKKEATYYKTKYGEEDWGKILKREIEIGWPLEKCLLAWSGFHVGVSPSTIYGWKKEYDELRTTTDSIKRKVLVYNYMFLYFENNILISIENRTLSDLKNSSF